MPRSPVTHDVRLTGFSDRAPLSAAWAWLDSQPIASQLEEVPPIEATGRVLMRPVVAGGGPPDLPRSAENGFAVRSADCDGASAYNPLLLALLEPGAVELDAGSAAPIASGMTLPSGADAVLPYEAAQPANGSLEVLSPVASGGGIERWRNAASAGTILLNQGHRLRPADVGCLAAMGVEWVVVRRRPKVAIVVPGAKSGPDALSPMLQALLARDEAVVETIPIAGDGERALTIALTDPRIASHALVLVAGRAGVGVDDIAALALRAAGGTLALHGIALRPGGASGLGTLPRTGCAGLAGGGLQNQHDTLAPNGYGEGPDTVPVVLLPGEPLACMIAYDTLAARLVRRLAGADTVSPYPVAEFELGRKIVSGIGLVEVVPVRLTAGRIVPIGIDAGLAGLLRADGFMMVPEASEGYPAASRVHVHLYNTRWTEAAREAGS